MTADKDQDTPPEDVKPWHRLHGTAELLATPEESVLHDDDFEALSADEELFRG